MEQISNREASTASPWGHDPAVVHRTEIDGVPTFWAKTGGPWTAGLTFRVGVSDETAVSHGVTHLVEHLAMAGLGSMPYHCNAMVDGTTTTFVARGAEHEVAAFIGSVCSALGKLPLGRLRIESRVLRTEAQGRGSGPVDNLLWLRYGHMGHGLTSVPEFGLNDPRPDPVQLWASTRFTRGNCVLWVAGGVPEAVHLALPTGPRRPPIEPHPIKGLLPPVHVQGPSGRVAIGFEGSRSSAAISGIRVAMSRLQKRVRQASGLSYTIGFSREHLTASISHNTVWLTCLDENAIPVRDELIKVLDELATAGPTPAELQEDLAALVRAGTDPEYVAQDVASTARYELFGMPPLSTRQLIEESREVRAADCVIEMVAMLNTSILATPRTAPNVDSRFRPYPTDCDPVQGQSFRRERWPWQKSDRLVVGRDGISYVAASGGVSTVLWRECVALASEGNGYWRLFGADGFAFRLNPATFKSRGVIERLIAGNVPRSLQVPPPS
jgi:hypothetical protein